MNTTTPSNPARGARIPRALAGRGPLAVALVALLVRLVFCFLVYPRVASRLHWLHVDDGFDQLAASLLAGHGFRFSPTLPPNLTTPPGYAFFLAFVFRLTGVAMNEGWRIWIVQSLLDTGTTVLIMAIAWRLLDSRRGALWAGMLYALYPQIIAYCARPFGEVLATFLLALAVLVAIEVDRRPAWLSAFLAGALFGLAALVKEKILVFPVLLAVAILWRWRRRGARQGAIAAVSVALGAAIAVGPWIARDYHLTGEIMPITSRTGRALHWGLRGDYAAGDPDVREFGPGETHHESWGMVPPTRSGDPGTPEARQRLEGDDRLLDSSFRVIRENPGHFLKMIPVKVLAFWYWGQPGVIWANYATQIPLLVLGVWGVILARDRGRLMVPLLLVIYFAGVHALLVARMRYSLPVMPYVVLFAGYTLSRMTERPARVAHPAAVAPAAPAR